MTLHEAGQKLRVDLAAAFHLAVAYNLREGIANHFSAVLPDGKVVRGDGAPAASARHIHAPIHRLAPRAKVLLHTHQPYATALTMLSGGRLEWALHTTGDASYDLADIVYP
ncbi:MAG: class II aldolase/adducin family protein [Proteobacteria bacterium]|nr:class II aldolase/adducin family protein [Pseudomonadota bacterium]